MNEPTTFRARAVSVLREDDVLIVAMADRAENPAQYLMLQRGMAPSRQDVRLGHDTVHVEVNDQGRSTYGGVVRCVLRADRMVVELEPTCARAVGTGTTIEVFLDAGDAQRELLPAALRELLAGRAEFRHE